MGWSPAWWAYHQWPCWQSFLLGHCPLHLGGFLFTTRASFLPDAKLTGDLHLALELLLPSQALAIEKEFHLITVGINSSPVWALPLPPLPIPNGGQM